MKLLLTSAGITNKSIESALLTLVTKKPEELEIAFIPTAANPFTGDKGWLEKNYEECLALNPKSFDIVDISLLEKEEIHTKLKKADVIFMGGGDEFYLMRWIETLKLNEVLKKLLKSKVYVGISAGSHVASKYLERDNEIRKLYEETISDNVEVDQKGLSLTNFYIWAHLNSKEFPNLNESFVSKLAKSLKGATYAIDDDTAVQVVDGVVKVISEGKWIKYN